MDIGSRANMGFVVESVGGLKKVGIIVIGGDLIATFFGVSSGDLMVFVIMVVGSLSIERNMGMGTAMLACILKYVPQVQI